AAQLPDEVVTGTLERQRRTAALAGAVVQAAGRPWPEPRVDPRLDEYPADRILGVLAPALAAADPSFAARVSAFHDAAGGPERNRYFQRMFEALTAAWASGQVTHPEVEAFAAFHARVSAAFGEVTARTGSRRVAFFTSGGPIGVLVQSTLGAPPDAALAVNSRVQNASLSSFTFSAGRVALDSFNVVEHLTPEERTFR
ncbi:MAG: histidine phosphatase family protein, partial [Deltaproteobacteria bacterium]|nr:histidine phosphatase family protein [Deltaproteobacteria bacterium]